MDNHLFSPSSQYSSLTPYSEALEEALRDFDGLMATIGKAWPENAKEALQSAFIKCFNQGLAYGHGQLASPALSSTPTPPASRALSPEHSFRPLFLARTKTDGEPLHEDLPQAFRGLFPC